MPHGEAFTAQTPIESVIHDPILQPFGRLLFPLTDAYWSGTTLGNIRLVWYTCIHPESTVAVINDLKSRAKAGKPIFLDIYSKAEKQRDPAKRNTGLFYFAGRPGEPFAVVNAGGGFQYVGAIHDSLPHALEISHHGAHAFALIYRPGGQTACEDLARAIEVIFRQAPKLGISTEGYSLWGGSAGARMAAWVGSLGPAAFGATRLPQASAVIMQYTGETRVAGDEPPTFACVGESDSIAWWRTMERRLNRIAANGTPTEFHHYRGLEHGFGLGIGTVADGWLSQAFAFWMKQISTAK